MNVSTRFHRRYEIQRIRSHLERDGFPRLQMLLLVSLTGSAGFVASYFFLRAGLTEMWLRYLASFGIAYLAFLVLLWLWLRTRAEDYADLPDILHVAPPSPDVSGAAYCGQGGSFDGGGASGSYDSLADHIAVPADAGDVIGDALGATTEAEEFAIPLAALLLVGALILSSFFMIYSAPVLFAELLVDGVLSASLYRKLRGLKTQHWLETALRRTAWPFVLTAVFVSATGWVMTLYAPGAHSIGDVVFKTRTLPVKHQ